MMSTSTQGDMSPPASARNPCFNKGLALTYFFSCGILKNSELILIPDDLRNCLELALGEEPSPASLDLYLPRIKEVIINLLQGLRLKQNLYREQQEAKAASSQQGAPNSSSVTGRSKSTGTNYRPTSNTAKSESDGGPRNQPTNPSTTPTVSISSPKDEKGNEETLALLRKSDAITRRASSRRQSHRFSTMLEQNAPPVPIRNLMNDPAMLAAYPGYPSSPGSTPATSPNAPPSYGQFPPIPNYDSSGFPFFAPSTNRLEGMPQPPTIPVPPPPTHQHQSTLSSTTSPQLGSSMLVNAAVSQEAANSPRPSLKTDGSSETVHTLVAPTGSSLAADAQSATSLPTADVTGTDVFPLRMQKAID